VKYVVKFSFTDPDDCDGTIAIVVEAGDKVGAIAAASSHLSSRLVDAATVVIVYPFGLGDRE